ncbi:glycosyltransferase [Clostridium manihotivorum]|uniref:Glycosyl transferase family 1 n=1 Tax=Clostridium manihotivorum TaxID=2320868 RepID=A0A3R5TJ47_9CLOT|nr:glycosyltransferase [Clostridium manihotivorum]QAA34710.1 glycosyl transferase family 1 [Clostridium manihotivorum]
MANNILILNSYFLPGFKGGGPVKSINNIVKNLYKEFNFYILTSDRDLNDEQRYAGIEINKWIDKDVYKICYIDVKHISFSEYKNIMNSVDFSYIYMNGFFSPTFTIKPMILRKLGFTKCKNVIVCPRGDFSPGHLKIKALKKYGYILFAKLTSLYNGVIWHSTSELETKHILNLYKNAKIRVASNLPHEKPLSDKLIEKEKKKDELKLVFISRLVPKKNLAFALQCLQYINTGKIDFHIYGPKESLEYWKQCEELIKSIKGNIKVSYKGELNQSEVVDTLALYHGFLFPTLGENYGHVIVEAMLAGCVPIISDETPWRELRDKEVGWDISLSHREEFIEAIVTLLSMDKKEFNKYSNNAYRYILSKSNYKEILEQTKNLFK